MGYKNIKKLPTANEIIAKIPLSDNAIKSVSQHKKEIEDILSEKDRRCLLIVGPCSAWPYDATLEYAKKLLELEDRVKDKIKLVMRTYIQKPRTIKGWTGPLNQPDPNGKSDIELGMIYARNLMVRVVEMG
jgi:3-deoxy-7-phosphoheptulonate synthase